MNVKRIVLSLGVIAIVGAVVWGGTGAFFSDTETSANNIFTAGSIDLKVDHLKQTYNGIDCKTCSVTVFSAASTTDVVGGVGAYAGGYPTDAAELTFIHPAWVPEASAAPAQWIWVTDPVLPADTTADAEYTFQNKFMWNGGVAGVNLDLALAADNGYKIVLNGSTIVDTLGTEFNYGALVDTSGIEPLLLAEVQNGQNVLEITVRNKAVVGGTPAANPAGLMFNMNIARPSQECAQDSDFQNMCKLWNEKDLTEGDTFFNFNDIKPGDYGTNVISLHVYDNDAYACVFPHDITDNDNGLTEPEGQVDTTDGVGQGELDDVLHFFAWADDGDGVYEGETTIAGPNASFEDAWSPTRMELEATTTAYLGIAWCAGTQTLNDGIACDGSTVNNASQSDSLTASLTAYVEQQRNNGNFSCANVIADYNGDNEIDWVETAQTGGDATESNGVLTLTTINDNDSRVRYSYSPIEVDLDTVTGFTYDAKQVSTIAALGNASFRMIVDLDGNLATAGDVTDVTYEPYYNVNSENSLNSQTQTTNGVWQTWKADTTHGKFWGNGITTVHGLSTPNGGAYATNFTIQELSTAYPNAKVIGVNIGMGTWNPGQVVEVDNLDFNNGTATGF